MPMIGETLFTSSYLSNLRKYYGSGESTAVERNPHNIEVLGSNPAERNTKSQ